MSVPGMAASGGGLRLQVVYAWRKHLFGYRLLGANDAISVGVGKRATFVAPSAPGWPRRHGVLRSNKRGGFRLRLLPGMSGQLHLRTGMRDVADVLAEPVQRRRDRGDREVDLFPGDAGIVFLDEACELKLQFTWVDPPEAVGRERSREPFFLRTIAATSVGLVALVTALWFFHSDNDSVEITPERFAKVVAPTIEKPSMRAAIDKAKEDGAKRRKEREAAMSKRAKQDEGRLGRKDAPQRETIIPKGREDVLREKVQKTGLLAALGNAKAGGSGLGRLLTESSSDVEQAVTGLVGTQLVAGRGSGGLGTVGAGPGGGGTGEGRIRGTGNLDVGAGRGTGRRGAGVGLSQGKEREVSVGMSTGNADTDGGLSRDQVNRVVKSHFAALKYCYEKELQRAPNLAGRVDLFWVIRTNGSVDRVKTASSTLENRAVEGCMERQVKAWQFPKSSGETHVTYPFFFKGAS